MGLWKTRKFKWTSLDAYFNLKNLGFHNLKKRIKSNEGFSSKPYKDQLGYLTIGYGHLILSNEKILLKKKIHKKELEEIFEKDFNLAENVLKFAVKNHKKVLFAAEDILVSKSIDIEKVLELI